MVSGHHCGGGKGRVFECAGGRRTGRKVGGGVVQANSLGGKGGGFVSTEEEEAEENAVRLQCG